MSHSSISKFGNEHNAATRSVATRRHPQRRPAYYRVLLSTSAILQRVVTTTRGQGLYEPQRFHRKQFIDVIHWTEPEDGILA